MWRPDPAAARPDLAQLPLLPPRAARIRGAQGRPRRRSEGTLHRRRACGVLPRRRLAGREPLTLTVYRARHSAQRGHRTPNRRHGDATALWRTPYTPEPWRRRGESHKTATAIWRRYGDATITMILSQFVSAPTQIHYAHLLRVLRYLRGTISRRLFFSL